MFLLQGKWSSHLDAIKCDDSGEPLEGVEPLRLWTVGAEGVGVGAAPCVRLPGGLAGGLPRL